jgi:hypothetical protein
MIYFPKNTFMDELVQFCYWCKLARFRIDIAGDRYFKHVIVTVSIGIVAFSVRLLVLLSGEGV